MKYYQKKGRANVECKECIELLFDYDDDDFIIGLKGKVDAHLEECCSCRNELINISSTMKFFEENMPVMTVDSCFTKQVMEKIIKEEIAAAFIRPMEGIGVILAIITLGILFVVGPTVFGLFMLAVNILLGLFSMAAVVVAAFPIIQISSSIILGILLVLVTLYMRNMVSHDSM